MLPLTSMKDSDSDSPKEETRKGIRIHLGCDSYQRKGALMQLEDRDSFRVQDREIPLR